MKLKTNLDNEVSLFPVYYNDKYWYESECGSIFKNLYHSPTMIRNDGAIYVGDGSWVFPDDTFEHDENR